MQREQSATGVLAETSPPPPGASAINWHDAARALTAVVALAACWHFAGVSPASLFSAESAAGVWHFLRNLFPPDLSPGFLRSLLSAVTQTILIATAGTLLSIVIGLPLGFLSTATLWRRGVIASSAPRNASAIALAFVCRATRALLGFLRAVPDLVWGLMFVVAIGLGWVAGALALAVSYAGVLGRVYADVFEDVDSRPLESLLATGATRTQVFLRGILPQAAPSALAYSLYSFECCMRAASVLGFVGAGGIGYEISLSMRMFEYGQVLTLILTLVALLAAADAASRFLRRRLHANAPAIRVAWSPWGFLRDRPGTSPLRRVLSVARLVSVAAIAVIIASDLSRMNVLPAVGGLEGVFGRAMRFVAAMFPPDVDAGFLRSLAEPLLQTIGISVIGTLIGIGLGGLLAVPSASTLMLSESESAGMRSISERALRIAAYSTARLVANILRSVPELVWTLICVIAVGFGPFAGTLAIGLHTAGVLGKLFAETIEEAPARPVEALRAAGARTAQILAWGIWPQVRPAITSYTILRWEMNLRVSTILGLVGGGGLGQAVFSNIQLGFYQRVSSLVLFIYVLVLASDWLGDRFRVRQAACP